MSTQSNAVSGAPFDSPSVPAAPVQRETSPFCWSVRRELWENRSIYIAPLVATAVGMLAFLISLIYLPHSMQTSEKLDPARQSAMLAQPFAHVAMLVTFTAFLVGLFYSLDALHGERRDRSILFWKSLPVSDRTTVFSKIVIPLVVLPVVVFVLAVISQVTILLISIFALSITGTGAATMWNRIPIFGMVLVLLYGLIVMALWYAPIYAWFLLVSGWARRATFLWAVIPWIAIAGFEFVAFRTTAFGSLLKDRLFGFAANAFNLQMPNGEMVDPHLIPLSQLTPARFLASPSLWLGLIFAAACIATAIRLRRLREPI